MITTQINETVFIHNSDFSGEVYVRDKNGGEATTQYNDLKELVINQLRERMREVVDRANLENPTNLPIVLMLNSIILNEDDKS